jgi:hypothetical protein
MPKKLQNELQHLHGSNMTKFLLAQEHIDHFRKHGVIEFDGIFTEEELLHFLASLENILHKSLLPTEHHPLGQFSNECLYQSGRNLWKKGAAVKKLLSKKQIGHLAAELFAVKSVRLAFDQYLKTGDNQDLPFKESYTLQQISSVRPILGALVLQLKPPHSNIELPFIPKNIGSAVFVAGNLALDLPSLFQEKDLSIFVVAFTTAKALYCLEPLDPHTHAYKKDGIIFGDAAGEDLCPTIYHR